MGDVRNMTIGEKVRAVRLEKGFSQQKLQEKSGVERNFISLVENNHRSPSFKTLMRIAKALGVSVGYITDYDKQLAERKRRQNKEQSLITNLSQTLVSNNSLLNSVDCSQFFPAPIINEATLIADLREFEEENIEDYVFISAKWVEAPLELERYCCLWVREREKALPPLIESGDLICLDSYQRDPCELDGDIVVLRDPKGGYSIKRLSFQGDHILGLPEDPMHQPPLLLPLSGQDCILGKVVWCWSKFDNK